MALLFLIFAVPRSTPAWLASRVDKTLFPYLLQVSLLSVIGPPLGRALTPWPWVMSDTPSTASDVHGQWLVAIILLLFSFAATALLSSPIVVAAFSWAFSPRWIESYAATISHFLKSRRGASEM